MSKLTILMVPSDQAGCGQYRIIGPGRQLGNYPDLSVILHVGSPADADVDDCDLLVVQRMRLQDRGEEAVDLNQALVQYALDQNKPVIYDTDDYDVALPKTHGLYGYYQKIKAVEKVDWMLNNASAVTTTTDYIAGKLQDRTNTPVHVVPNCINYNEPRWNYPKPESNRIRIGWAGGASHLEDLKLLSGVVEALFNIYGDKLEFIIGGYDTRGTYSYYDELGKIQTRASEGHETIWIHMVDSLFGSISKSAKRVLKTLPFDSYGWHYSQMDIGLVPLIDTEFNRCKSPLKLLEFGAYGVPVVASNVEPYAQVLGSGLVTTQTPGKTLNSWVSAVRRLIDDPVERAVQGHKLNALVRARFDATKEVENTNRLYRSLIK